MYLYKWVSNSHFWLQNLLMCDYWSKPKAQFNYTDIDYHTLVFLVEVANMKLGDLGLSKVHVVLARTLSWRDQKCLFGIVSGNNEVLRVWRNSHTQTHKHTKCVNVHTTLTITKSEMDTNPLFSPEITLTVFNFKTSNTMQILVAVSFLIIHVHV